MQKGNKEDAHRSPENALPKDYKLNLTAMVRTQTTAQHDPNQSQHYASFLHSLTSPFLPLKLFFWLRATFLILFASMIRDCKEATSIQHR